jgi:hypothetical protein
MEMNVILLGIAHPQYQFSLAESWHWPEPRYQAIARKPLETRLYCLITADPDEMNETLKTDQAHHSQRASSE